VLRRRLARGRKGLSGQKVVGKVQSDAEKEMSAVVIEKSEDVIVVGGVSWTDRRSML